jgi:hypothetical protein
MKKNLNLYIYNYIKTNGKLPKHKYAEKSKYAYHCKKLLEEGSIEKKGYGVWVAKQVQTSSTSRHIATEKIRSHGYRFKIRVPHLTGWNIRTRYFNNKNILYKPIPQGQIIKVRRHNVYLYNDSIQVTFIRGKSFSTKNIDLNNSMAIIEFKKTMTRLSNMLKTDFKIDNNYMFQCHHASIKNKIAKWHLDRGVTKFTVKDSNGEEWLLMDNSFNLMELETIHPVTSSDDMKSIVIPLMNKLKEDPIILQRLENTLVEQNNVIKSMQEQLLAEAHLNREFKELMVNYIKSNSNR